MRKGSWAEDHGSASFAVPEVHTRRHGNDFRVQVRCPDFRTIMAEDMVTRQVLFIIKGSCVSKDEMPSKYGMGSGASLFPKRPDDLKRNRS